MSEFRYIAVDKNGKTVKGQINASSKNEVHAILERKGLYPLEIKEFRASKIKLNLSFGVSKVNDEALILFTSELATLIQSGLTIVDALQGLYDQEENPTLKKIIMDIKENIEGGTSISNAFKKYPSVFSSIYTSLLTVGEATGRLDKVLFGIYQYLERDLDIRRKISSAFAYPKFVVIVVTGVVIFMLSVVLPRFTAMFTAAGANLPTPTRILLSVSNFIRFKWYIIVAVIVMFYAIYRIIYSTKKGRLAIDLLKLKIPLFGRINKFGSLSRFVRSLALISGSGYNILDGLMIASSVANNAYIIKEIEEVAKDIRSGESFSESLTHRSFFPRVMVQMVSVGERSGLLDSSLERLADLWDRSLDYTLRNLASKIEPALIVILGVIVGFIALAMYLPMFTLPSLINK
ncbi:type II secretion system F family protein [Caldisericum exile]|uniref:Type IV pilus assembly protein PilC n=1 Tax=Caldisericum exile (strain DSM 21853 / NBRC 104410 / AZM16c01) TaxID=511051 RepID=A0A7U6JFF6_CALEA|nr:type II secretion system F family protein [Caldisericum exile]BAL81438.1 putative type IV pilus assembly protein PilC [Caldisericum exile AZM16c01]